MGNLMFYGGIVAALLCIVRYVVYPAFFSPLAKIPIPNAHSLSPYTDLWILWIRYKEKVNETVYFAHQKHGPVVRLGPNELSICCIDNGVNTVYASKTWGKHHFYSAFRNFGVEPMFATRNRQLHGLKRKRVSNVFSKSYLQSSADFQAILKETLLERFLPRLVKLAETGETVNVMLLNKAVNLDLATAYFWGLNNGTRYLEDDAACAAWQNMYLTGRPPSMFFAPIELSTITTLLSTFGISSLPSNSFHYNDMTDAWCLELCDKAEATLESADHGSMPGHAPVVYSQLKDAISKEPLSSDPDSSMHRTSPTTFRRHQKLPVASEKVLAIPRSPQQIEAAAELLDEIVASNDVLGVTLDYICWQLSKSPNWQERLHDEVMSVSHPMNYPSIDGHLPLPKELDRLPVLRAVIMETMRLYATNPGMEPRITPADTNITLGSYTNIPAGVRVSASPYSLHRNPEVYPEPEAWRPQRWMPGGEGKTEWAGNGQAEQWFWGFSSGPRMCIGNHLSMQRRLQS